MIPYIGIDAVDIYRFNYMQYWQDIRLQRIFTPSEIMHCRQNSHMAASKLATRFAAKEAVYKALSQITTPPPFLTLCRCISITTHPSPHIQFRTDMPYQSSLSLSHTPTTAIAAVIIWQYDTR